MKLHSVVDIITNSSSVIYTCINTDYEKFIYKGLNNILRALNINQPAEELFNIKVVVDECKLDDLHWDWDDLSKDKQRELYGNSFDRFVEENIEDYDSMGNGREIKVYDNQGNEVKFISLFINAYSWESTWDG